MSDWAQKEIEIACARERAASGNPDEWDYGCACYESAMKAYRSLMEDEHSGYSIGVTKNILVRLIEGKPLTPIDDVPEVWNKVPFLSNDDTVAYQCSRMSSLFKYVDKNGTVTYSDNDRVTTTYVTNPGIFWHNGTASHIINEMSPISMPYWPLAKSYVVYAEEFLLDPANGDYDTVGYLYATTPDGERIEIGRYFAEKDGKFEEITFEEYCERKKAAEEDKK
jgi:hypothetical protein